MLLVVKYSPPPNRTPSERRRVREIFVAWEPPAGVELRTHYHYISGGGFLIVETQDAAGLFQALEPFKPLVTFEIEPVINVIEAIAISLDIEEWAASILPDI